MATPVSRRLACYVHLQAPGHLFRKHSHHAHTARSPVTALTSTRGAESTDN